MGVTVRHVLSATTPDNTNYEIRPSHWNSDHAISVSLSASEVIKWIAAGSLSLSSGTVSFADSNGISFGMDAGTITAQHNALTAQSNQAFSAQGGSSQFQTLSFSNANGVSFSNSDGAVVGSVATTYAASNHSHGNPTLVLTNLSGSTASNSAGLTLSISAADQGLTSQSNQAFSAQGGSSAFQTLGFSNANGVSFSNSNGSVVGSVQTNYAASNVTSGRAGTSTGFSGTNVSASMTLDTDGLALRLSAAAVGGNFSAGVSGGNTSGQSGTVSNRLVIAGGNNVTLSGSTDANGMSVTISGANAAGAQTGISGVQVSDATYSSGTVSFRNANGISFGSSGANGVSASYTVPTVTNSSMSVSDAASSGTLARIAFTNLNGVTLSLSTGAGGSHTIVGSHNALTSQSNQALSAGNGSFAFQTASFSNANGISFSTSAGSAIVASHNGLTSQSNQAFSAQGGSSAFQTLVFANSNGVSFSNTNGSLWASVAAQTAQTMGIYGSSQTTAQSSSTTVDARSLTIRGAGQVSVGMSAGELIISVTAPAPGGADGGVFLSAVGSSQSAGNIIFSNSNGLSFGMDGSTVTASHNALTSQSNQAVSGQNGSYAFQTLSLSNANGISFGTSAGSAITASHNALTTARASNDAIGLNTAQSNVTWTANSSGLSLDARGYAGTGTSATNASLTLNSNGLAISVGAAAADGGIFMSAAGSSQSAGNIVLSNSNGIAFGMDGSTVTASHNGLTTQSAQAFSADASSTFQTLSFQNSNGVSFSNNAGALRVTHALQFTSATSAITSNALHTSASRVFNIVAATNSTGGGTASLSSNVSFSAANGLTFYTSAGGAIVGSHNALTTARASNDAIGINTAQSNVTWTVNSAGLSLDARGYAGTGTSATNASVTLNSNGLAISVAAPGGGGGAAISAAGSSQNAGTIVFSNSNGVSFGMDGSTITATVTPGAAAGIAAFANSNTTYTSGTVNFLEGGGALTIASTTGQQFRLSVPALSSLSATGQVSISTNGSTISIGVPNPSTQDGFNPYADLVYVMGQVGNGTLQIDPQGFPDCQFDRILFPLHASNSSNSSGSHTISVNVGLYTKNGSTLSRYSSWQGTTAVTHSGTQGSYSQYSGLRMFTFAANGTIPAGRYWIGVASVTSSGGTNATYSNMMVSNLNSNYTGVFGQAAANTAQFTLGQGLYSTTTNGMPASIAFSHITGTGSQAQRPPVIGFAMGTA